MNIRIRLEPGPVLVFLLFVRTLVHAILASWTPLSAQDWDQYMWMADRDHPSTMTVLVGHGSFSRLLELILAYSQTLHVIATPAMGTLLLVVAFAFARKRLPSARWDDVLDIAILSALIWIGEPKCGLVFTYRPYVAQAVWGATLVLAVLLPYRCGWRVRGVWLVPFVLGAFLAGSTVYSLCVPAIVGAVYATVRAKQRAAWMWVGVAALAGGFATMLSLAPSFDARVWSRGFEGDLTTLSMSLREHGELIAFVAGLALVAAVANAARPGWAVLTARTDDAAELTEAPRWLCVWGVLLVLALCGPTYSEATLMPGTLVLAIAALPFVRLLARPLGMRLLIVALVVFLHAQNWGGGLMLYARIDDEYAARLDAIRATKASGVAVVKPYSEIKQGFWFFGEDWDKATGRENAARSVFGLADIEMAAPFRSLERSARLSMTLESTGLSNAQLLDARRPSLWPRDLNVARTTFSRFAYRMLRVAPEATAHLAVTTFSAPALKGRTVYVGWVEDGKITLPHARRSAPDTEDRYHLPLESSYHHEYPEALAIGPKGDVPVQLVDGQLAYTPLDAGLWYVVVCNAKRCLAVDAFMLDFN